MKTYLSCRVSIKYSGRLKPFLSIPVFFDCHIETLNDTCTDLKAKAKSGHLYELSLRNEGFTWITAVVCSEMYIVLSTKCELFV